MNLSLREVTEAMSLIGKEDVFEAKIVLLGATCK